MPDVATTVPRSWRTARSRNRLIAMMAAGLLAGLITAFLGAWPYALLVGWDVAAFVFALSAWAAIASLDAEQTASHATHEDPGAPQTTGVVIAASVASLAAVGFVLVQASSAKGGAQDLLAGVGLLSIALSWFAVHTLFALRYARLYYGARLYGGQPGGIDFNQDAPPRYLDFAYLAFTVGMTFQVSDTELQAPTIRATVLRQALLSYLFGAVILGATINLISGLASKG